MDPSISQNPETNIEQPLTPEQKIIKELAELYPGDSLVRRFVILLKPIYADPNIAETLVARVGSTSSTVF